MPASDRRAPRLLRRLRARCRSLHLSQRTEQAYVSWVRRFIRFQGLRRPEELGEKEVVAFLVKLAAEDIGLRLMEAATLRVKDVDFDRGEIRVTRGKVTRIGSPSCRGPRELLW